MKKILRVLHSQKKHTFRSIRMGIGIGMAFLVAVSSFHIMIPQQAVYAYEEKNGTVTGDAVNVRTGAGTEHDIVTQLNKGQSVRIIGEAADAKGTLWYRISFTQNGQSMEGYMSSTYIELTAESYEEKDGYVTGDGVRVRKGAGTEYGEITKLDTGHMVHIKGEVVASTGKIWYWITFTKDGQSMEGYMHSDYVRTSENPDEFTPSPDVSDADYERYLEQQGFPEIYRIYLRSLHKINPKWVFVALPTDLEWKTAVDEESKLGRNLVQDITGTSVPMSYKSLQEGAIDWTTGKWKGFDGESWKAASRSLIRYYMDPRNFLQGENTMLQFESLKYEPETQTKAGVEDVIKNTYMEYGKTVIGGEVIDFAQIFMDAGKAKGVSPIYLASRVKQETGVNGSDSSREIKEKPANQVFNGYYNFFNIGASPSAEHDSVYNGLARAKAEGWDSPEKSIMGGAQFVAANYIAKGQNTLYLQKFDVVDTDGDGYYWHQYMTNLQAAASEAKLMEKAYKNFKEAAVTYIVPIYKNMPEVPPACPTDNGSPYNVLSSIGVTDLPMTEEFDEFNYHYTAAAHIAVQYVNIYATAYAPGATITGTGVVEVAVGENTFEVNCTGTDGLTRTYTITIYREGEGQVQMGDVNGDSVVNSVDALLILRASVGLETLTEDQRKRADVNQDNQVDSSDALLILQYITGEIPNL